MFFDDDEIVETEIEFEQTVLKSYSAELLAEDSKLSYSCPTGKGELDGVGKEAAKKLSEDFINRMGGNYSRYVLDRITYKNGGYQLEYYESVSYTHLDVYKRQSYRRGCTVPERTKPVQQQRYGNENAQVQTPGT